MPSYSIDMEKSGRINRYEPIDTSWAIKFPKCAALFRTTGWFSFFKKITGFNPKVSHHFAQNFINEAVTFNTLRFELTEDLIAKSICVPTDGESWFKNTPFSFNPNDFLLLGNETLDWGKGVQLEKFKPEWNEEIGIVQNYITCDGRFSLVSRTGLCS